MSTPVVSIPPETPVNEGLSLMQQRSLHRLPVVEHGRRVGILTETDLFKLFLEFMGARERGVRATRLPKEEKGGLAHLARAIAEAGGNIVALGLFRGEDAASRTATVKVGGITAEALQKALRPHALRVIDLRTL